MATARRARGTGLVRGRPALRHPSGARRVGGLDHPAQAHLEPNRFALQRDLGIAELNLGRVDAAIDALGAAVQLDPTSAEAQHHLGAALGMGGRVDEGLPHLAEAARLAPADAEIQNHWGVALTVAGRPGDAVAHFTEALRLRSDYSDARDNLARALARRDAAAGRDGTPQR
ncbi:MAG: tetratricopeptide repeat protein [Candidatus Binatia bacterium]